MFVIRQIQSHDFVKLYGVTNVSFQLSVAIHYLHRNKLVFIACIHQIILDGFYLLFPNQFENFELASHVYCSL